MGQNNNPGKQRKPLSLKTRVLVTGAGVLLLLAVIGAACYFGSQPSNNGETITQKRDALAKGLYSRQDIDPRAAVIGQQLHEQLEHIEDPRVSWQTSDPPTFQRVASFLSESIAYELKPEDIGYSFEDIAQLELTEVLRNHPPYRVYVEWRAYPSGPQQNSADGGLRFWIDQPGSSAPRDSHRWTYTDLYVHLPQPQAEALIKKAFGDAALPVKPAEITPETPGELFRYKFRYQMATGCNPEGLQVFIYGFSQKFPKDPAFWSPDPPSPLIKSIESTEHTLVIHMNEREPVAPPPVPDPEKQFVIPGFVLSPKKLDLFVGSVESDQFDLREFSQTVRNAKLHPCQRTTGAPQPSEPGSPNK